MKINILGTRGEIEESAPYHSKKSGVLINDELLLDIGDKRFLDYDPKYILITHLHPDHAYFVRHHKQPSFDIPIYAPEKYDHAKIHITNKPFKIDGYHVVPIPTVHSLKVKSNAYLITYKNRRILYTGDMIWIDKKYRSKLKDIDLVITEASFMRDKGMVRRKDNKIFGHTGVPNLISLFQKYTCTIVFVHFGAWFYKDIQKGKRALLNLGKQHGVNVIVGYDGLRVELV